MKCMVNYRHTDLLYQKENRYLQCRASNDSDLKEYCNQYSKTLTKVIIAAKKLSYDRRITHSKNKMKTTWSIIKNELRKESKKDMQYLDIKGKIIYNQQILVDAVNDYYIQLLIISVIAVELVKQESQPMTTT
jgi:hypothetical protein